MTLWTRYLSKERCVRSWRKKIVKTVAPSLWGIFICAPSTLVLLNKYDEFVCAIGQCGRIFGSIYAFIQIRLVTKRGKNCINKLIITFIWIINAMIGVLYRTVSFPIRSIEYPVRHGGRSVLGSVRVPR